ncbi:EAL domain-containing protein [Aerophototrophica crusticola]|uniref:EAL domain-containing protein n=1 Tax=Aerophototrophica crusticola TaxID=1709002 RepID=A0A858R318_9PROT|nr:EAL domain-containing protein [Rhodospirillaceae bacterium B3]
MSASIQPSRGPGGDPPGPQDSHPAAVRVPLRKRLSYKQARNTALLTLVLGFVLSTAQITIDLLDMERKTDQLVQQVLSTLQEPAAEAAYAFDQALAERVLTGLFEYRPVYKAVIFEDFGNQLAAKERPQAEGNLKWLAETLLPQEKTFSIPLIIERHNQNVGEMRVSIDRFLIAQEFFRRSGVVLGTGVIWTVALALILVVMFYVSITKPFLRMAGAIAEVDAAKPADRLLAVPSKHADDELGLLAKATNGLLQEFDRSLVERQRVEGALRERETRLSGIMDNVADGIITLDEDLRIETMNTAALDLFGYGPGEATGQPFVTLIEERDWTRVAMALMACLRRADDDRRRDSRAEIQGRRRTGDVFAMAFGVSQMRLGDRRTAICVVQDITQRKRAEQALRESEERLKLAVRATRSGVFDNNLAKGTHWWSPEFVEMLGYDAADAGNADQLFAALLHPDDKDNVLAQMDRYLAGDPGDYLALYRLRQRDGAWVWIEARGQALRDDGGRPLRFTGTMTDVSDRKRFEEQLMYVSTHDPLTGLPNRTLVQDRLHHAIAHAERKGTCVAVLLLDLDRFKLVNDSLGHQAGDKLLRAMAQRLTSSVRAADTVGRLGADEFLIVAEDLPDPQMAARIAETILVGLSSPFVVDGQQLFITTSIGISLFPGDAGDINALVRDADTAMHNAKAAGGNGYRFFTPEMNEAAVARLSLEHSLRDGLEQNQFFLHYQPKIDLETMQPVGVEALIRWQHPEIGLVSPARFIPVAEETGMIVQIGEWVMRTALAQIREWEAKGFAPLPVAVNVSVRQITNPKFGERVVQLCAESGVSPELLELEITETAMMSNLAYIADTLNEVRGAGIRIAIDDFGTGYSSLSYLRRLPITTLKVDRSFVAEATTNADTAAIAATIIAMGRQLGLKVVAEGIETAEQLEFLRHHRCDELQGYYFSRPLPAAELEARFLRRAALAVAS